MPKSGTIRAGIGGWTYEPWRGAFYPEGLPHAKELSYASRALPTIEINGTFYRTQTPATFAKWAREVPDGFVFSLKGPRFAVNRRVLAEAGESVARFLASGPAELGDRLGPILWQFAPTKKFDAADVSAFLDLLPRKLGTSPLRHVVEVRHASFAVPEFVALLKRHGVAVVLAEHASYPMIPDVTSDFLYLRLQKGRDAEPTGYPARALGRWAQRCQAWAAGGAPADLEAIDPRHAPAPKPRDVFVYFIHEGKMRAPAAAAAFMQRLAAAPPPPSVNRRRKEGKSNE